MYKRQSLIQNYLLDNPHGAIVIVTPEKGRTARMETELEEKLQEYKASLTAEEIETFVQKTHALEDYQSEPDVYKRQDIFQLRCIIEI